MRRRTVAVQQELFAPDGPAIPMSTQQKENLIGLIGALILEVMTNPTPVTEGGDHDPDHD